MFNPFNISIMKKLKKIRDNAVAGIMEIMKAYGLSEVEATDIDDGSSPVLFYDPDDDENTFTLDRIELEDGKLSFDSSSSWDSRSSDTDDLSTDALVEIHEWLSDYYELFVDRNGNTIHVGDSVVWHDEAGVDEDGSMITFSIKGADGYGYFDLSNGDGDELTERWAFYTELEVL